MISFKDGITCIASIKLSKLIKSASVVTTDDHVTI